MLAPPTRNRTPNSSRGGSCIFTTVSRTGTVRTITKGRLKASASAQLSTNTTEARVATDFRDEQYAVRPIHTGPDPLIDITNTGKNSANIGVGSSHVCVPRPRETVHLRTTSVSAKRNPKPISPQTRDYSTSRKAQSPQHMSAKGSHRVQSVCGSKTGKTNITIAVPITQLQSSSTRLKHNQIYTNNVVNSSFIKTLRSGAEEDMASASGDSHRHYNTQHCRSSTHEAYKGGHVTKHLYESARGNKHEYQHYHPHSKYNDNGPSTARHPRRSTTPPHRHGGGTCSASSSSFIRTFPISVTYERHHHNRQSKNEGTVYHGGKERNEIEFNEVQTEYENGRHRAVQLHCGGNHEDVTFPRRYKVDEETCKRKKRIVARSKSSKDGDKKISMKSRYDGKYFSDLLTEVGHLTRYEMKLLKSSIIAIGSDCGPIRKIDDVGHLYENLQTAPNTLMDEENAKKLHQKTKELQRIYTIYRSVKDRWFSRENRKLETNDEYGYKANFHYDQDDMDFAMKEDMMQEEEDIHVLKSLKKHLMLARQMRLGEREEDGMFSKWYKIDKKTRIKPTIIDSPISSTLPWENRSSNRNSHRSASEIAKTCCVNERMNHHEYRRSPDTKDKKEASYIQRDIAIDNEQIKRSILYAVSLAETTSRHRVLQIQSQHRSVVYDMFHHTYPLPPPPTYLTSEYPNITSRQQTRIFQNHDEQQGRPSVPLTLPEDHVKNVYAEGIQYVDQNQKQRGTNALAEEKTLGAYNTWSQQYTLNPSTNSAFLISTQQILMSQLTHAEEISDRNLISFREEKDYNMILANYREVLDWELRKNRLIQTIKTPVEHEYIPFSNIPDDSRSQKYKMWEIQNSEMNDHKTNEARSRQQIIMAEDKVWNDLNDQEHQFRHALLEEIYEKLADNHAGQRKELESDERASRVCFLQGEERDRSELRNVEQRAKEAVFDEFDSSEETKEEEVSVLMLSSGNILDGLIRDGAVEIVQREASAKAAHYALEMNDHKTNEARSLADIYDSSENIVSREEIVYEEKAAYLFSCCDNILSSFFSAVAKRRMELITEKQDNESNINIQLDTVIEEPNVELHSQGNDGSYKPQTSPTRTPGNLAINPITSITLSLAGSSLAERNENEIREESLSPTSREQHQRTHSLTIADIPSPAQCVAPSECTSKSAKIFAHDFENLLSHYISGRRIPVAYFPSKEAEIYEEIRKEPERILRKGLNNDGNCHLSIQEPLVGGVKESDEYNTGETITETLLMSASRLSVNDDVPFDGCCELAAKKLADELRLLEEHRRYIITSVPIPDLENIGSDSRSPHRSFGVPRHHYGRRCNDGGSNSLVFNPLLFSTLNINGRSKSPPPPYALAEPLEPGSLFFTLLNRVEVHRHGNERDYSTMYSSAPSSGVDTSSVSSHSAHMRSSAGAQTLLPVLPPLLLQYYPPSSQFPNASCLSSDVPLRRGQALTDQCHLNVGRISLVARDLLLEHVANEILGEALIDTTGWMMATLAKRTNAVQFDTR